MKGLNLILAVCVLLVGFAVPSFGAQIYLNINLPDMQFGAGSSEGEKGGSIWGQVYADLRLTSGTIEQVGIYYNPQYTYDPISGQNTPSPDKGYININFSGPMTAPALVEDYMSQQISLDHGGVSLNESVSFYAYKQDVGGDKGVAPSGPIWSCASGNFYGNFHILGSGYGSFNEYNLDGDNGKQPWFNAYINVPIQWDVAPGTSVPAMSLANSPSVPEPSTFMLMAVGIIAGIGVYLRRKRS